MEARPAAATAAGRPLDAATMRLDRPRAAVAGAGVTRVAPGDPASAL